MNNILTSHIRNSRISLNEVYFWTDTIKVLEGAVPDRYRFTADIKAAEKSRYLRNKAGKFCDVCSVGK